MNPGAPLPTLRRSSREGSDQHFRQLLAEAASNALDGQPEVCVSNLTHAIQVLLGVDEQGPGAVPPEVRALLDLIVQKAGGFR